jgi:hypothetical protein
MQRPSQLLPLVVLYTTAAAQQLTSLAKWEAPLDIDGALKETKRSYCKSDQ